MTSCWKQVLFSGYVFVRVVDFDAGGRRREGGREERQVRKRRIELASALISLDPHPYPAAAKNTCQ